MHIGFVEISNFRKLKDVRVEFHEETTLFVGANNSGKTSAMVALRYFLHKRDGFSINDFTLCHRAKICAIGQAWLSNAERGETAPPRISEWGGILPLVDVWFEAKQADLHYVSHVIPTLDWTDGYIGVRLQYQPADVVALYREFIDAYKAAQTAKDGAKSPDGSAVEVALWPADLVDFLKKRLGKHFKVIPYILDPAKIEAPEKGLARPQQLPADAVSLEDDPLAGLIRIDEIPAQRGFSDGYGAAGGGPEATPGRVRGSRRLANQFREYFASHLDPSDKPEAADVLALKAIEEAQKAFDDRLTSSFSGPLKEMEGLGYPGVTDPRVKISTKLRPTDGLDHEAAVQYEVAAMQGAAALLPEDYNGLGYQNLISMVFRLMSFRDGWMRVGKAKDKNASGVGGNIPPLHLVLIEEPEAHLHAQVQQVFIRKAYGLLRNHEWLGGNKQFRTQLIVSSHSSHVAHEVDFACLRYFRRLPAGYPGAGEPVATVPISTVINLTAAFGSEEETSRFAKRYLRATHCDLFFADAAIFIEGAAERMLLPHFVKGGFEYLNQCYITWLEVGGSHAHRLQPLIERLGLLSLVVTDLDAGAPGSRKAARPIKSKGLVTNNATLKSWLPKESDLDTLLSLPEEKKISEDGPLFAVRVAYQLPLQITTLAGAVAEVIPYTFEDAIVFKNLKTIGAMSGTGMTGKFSQLVKAETDAEKLAENLFAAIDSGKKAEFALDLLELKEEPGALDCPDYIADGLRWLEKKLKDSRGEVLAPVVSVVAAASDIAGSAHMVADTPAPRPPQEDTGPSAAGEAA